MDTLRPAEPPAAKGARLVRSLDGDPLDLAQIPKPAPSCDYKALAMNNKAASLRTLLHDNPAGLNYDELCKYTGIARDRIATHMAGLIREGDAKEYELAGRGRFFRFTGDPRRIAPRFPDAVPTITHATTPPAAKPSTAADRKPADRSSPPASDRALDSAATTSTAAPRIEGAQDTGLADAGRTRRADAAASPGRPAEGVATPQPVAPQTSVSARPDTDSLAVGGPASATDPKTEAPRAEEAARPSADRSHSPGDRPLTPARASAIIDGAHAIAIELVAVTANTVITEVRAAFGDRELQRTWPELARAISNFERADRIYVGTKGRA